VSRRARVKLPAGTGRPRERHAVTPPRAVVGDNDDAAVGVFEDVVAAVSAHPSEPGAFEDLRESGVGGDAEAAHAVTSTRHVPTNSDAASAEPVTAR
jgi:hypothetical protein